jgi:disulfide bond formation protein DsbB
MIFFKNEKLFFFNLSLLWCFCLIMGFVAEYVFDIKPCILCIYQRYLIGLLASLNFFLVIILKQRVNLATWLLVFFVTMCGCCFAFYQIGVESHWWKGPEFCSSNLEVPDFSNLSEKKSVEAFQNMLSKTKIVRCDQVNWRIFTISANIWIFLFYKFVLLLMLVQRWLTRKR